MKDIDVSDQLVTTAVIVKILTVPRTEPKPVPVIVTLVPGWQLIGDRASIWGTGSVTVKVTALSLVMPALLLTLTVYDPTATPGTTQTIDVFDQLVTAAEVVPPWL